MKGIFSRLFHPKQKQPKQRHSASSASLLEPSVTSPVKVPDRPNSIHQTQSRSLDDWDLPSTDPASASDDGAPMITNKPSTSVKTANPDLHAPKAASPTVDPSIPAVKTSDSPLVSTSRIIKAAKKYQPFKRLPLHNAEKGKELKVLNYSYVMGESASLQEAVSITCNLVDLAENTGSDIDGLLEIAEISSTFIVNVVKAVERGVDGKGIAEFEPEVAKFIDTLQQISQALQIFSAELPNDASRNFKNDKRIVDRCTKELKTVISTIEIECPSLAHRDKSDPVHSTGDSIAFALGSTIGILRILKEAAGIAPVPFLQGAIGTVLVLVETAHATRSNRDDMLRLASTAADFVASVREAYDESPKNVLSKLQSAINTFVGAFNVIVAKARAFSERSLLSRIVARENDQAEINGYKEELQRAISTFQITTQIFQQQSLDAILAGLEDIKYTMDGHLVESLRHASVTYDNQEYLASTRIQTLTTISEWIENPAADKRVFWLHGAAGMGKSTIAHHLRKVLGEAGRLAAHFFFKRHDKAQERPDFIIGTLAYQLAHVDQRLRAVICTAIQSTSPDQLFSSQFKAFILNALQAGSFPLPMVIIIDALDEYDDIMKFLRILVQSIPHFPSNVKLFLTSRYEREIESHISKLGAETLELRSASTRAMTALFQERLEAIERWRNRPPTEEQISRLVSLADGLFNWAATACNLIAQVDLGPPDQILNQILMSQSEHRRLSESPLDSLYSVSLEHLFPKTPGPDLHAKNFQHVFGAVFVVKDLLTIDDLQTLLGDSVPVDSVFSALRGLQTRVTSDITPDTPVTPAAQRFHASFLDFIVNPERCPDGRFLIDPLKSHNELAKACFQLIDLHRSSTGYIQNSHRYAIDNWARHCNADILSTDPLSTDLHDAVDIFCQRNFVEWFQIQILSVDKDGLRQGSDIPDDCHDAPDRLNHFVTVFQRHSGFMGLKDINNVNKIVSVQNIAVRLSGDNHPKRADHLDNLGRLLTRRHRIIGQITDIETAVDVHRKASVLRPASDPDRATSLSNLGNTLSIQFDRTDQLPDLEEAITRYRETLRLLTPENPIVCTVSTNLGCRLMGMFSRTQKSEYLNDAVIAFRAAVTCESASASQRLRAARLWAHHTEGNHDSVWEAYQSVLKFLPRWDKFMRYLAQSTVVPLNVPIEAEEHVDRLGPAIHLDNLQPHVSPQTNPTEWTCLNRKFVAIIARLLLSRESVTATCQASKVYPFLTLYTLADILSGSYVSEETKHARLSGILEVLESWNAWDDIAALAHHQTIRDGLLTCLGSVRTQEPRDNAPDGTHGMTLDQVLKMDANIMDALLLATLQDHAKYKYLVRQYNQDAQSLPDLLQNAQSLLDLLQARLGFPLDASLKHLYTGALITLSRFSGLYPECMTLNGIQLVGDTAMEPGSYGDIWKGLLDGEVIAVKKLRIFREIDKDKLLKGFCSEAVLWRQLNHRNVLPFYGVFRLDNNSLCFASPWMDHGNVVRFLKSAPETKCIPLMLDIAEGLDYLHTLRPRIIHGNMKGVNILITQSRRACLGDFGFATTKDSQSFPVTSAVSTRPKGELRWQAPELIDPNADDANCGNTLASDVYAYGFVCYEIFSGLIPFHEITNDFRVMGAVLQGKRPSRPVDDRSRIRGLDDEMWHIVESCWAQDPAARPPSHQIVERLRSSPTWTADERPVDNFDPSFRSRKLYSQADHPFTYLSDITNEDD